MVAGKSGVIFVSAPEEFLVRRAVSAAVSQIRDSLSGADATIEWEILSHDARTVTTSELASALSPSLFSTHSICIIDDAQTLPAGLYTALSSLVENLPENFWVIISFLGAPTHSMAKKLAAFAQQEYIIPAVSKNSDKIVFIRNEFRSFGRSVSPEIAQLIIDVVGSDVANLAAAVSQLSYDCPERIDAQTIMQYFCGKPEISGYDIAEAVVSGDLAAAVESLRWALYHGVPHVIIADALADTINTMIRLQSLNADPVTKAQMLKIPLWRVKKLHKNIPRWKGNSLAKAMELCAQLNIAVKGASPVPEYVLENTVNSLACLAA